MIKDINFMQKEKKMVEKYGGYMKWEQSLKRINIRPRGYCFNIL